MLTPSPEGEGGKGKALSRIEMTNRPEFFKNKTTGIGLLQIVIHLVVLFWRCASTLGVAPPKRQLRSNVTDTVVPDHRVCSVYPQSSSLPALVEFPLLSGFLSWDTIFLCWFLRYLPHLKWKILQLHVAWKKPNVLLSFIHSFEVIIAITVSCAFFPNHNDLRLTEYGKRDGTVFSSRQFCEANGSNLSHFLVSEDFICPQDDFGVHTISYLEAKILFKFLFSIFLQRMQVWVWTVFHRDPYILWPRTSLSSL